MKAMILAAGRGKRLRPLTDTCPKPLVKVKGKRLIEYHLEKLAQTGVEQVIINYAWLGEQFEPALGRGASYGLDITYSPEIEGGLETAGGIIQALPLLGAKPFWVINADVFTDFDFANLAQDLPQGVLAHLILVTTPTYKEEGDFGLENGKVLPSGEFTFSGISLISPELLAGRKVERLALAPILREAMEQGLVTGEVYTGKWNDIGTPERLAEAEES